MFRQYILILATLLTTGCATTMETVYVPADSAGWKLGYGSDHSNQTIAEYVPTNESINSWSKLLTIQFLEGVTQSPSVVMENLKARRQALCPGSNWNVISHDNTSVLYEWKVVGCSGNADQHEIARLLKGNEGVHRIAYVEKTSAIDPVTRERWIKAFTDAYVERDGKKIILSPQN